MGTYQELSESSDSPSYCGKEGIFTVGPSEPPLNENVLDVVKVLSHDIRGGLVSMAGTLKLLTRGYYGRIDEHVQSRLDELLSRTVNLVRMTEEYLDFAVSLNENPGANNRSFDLFEEIINPIFEEFSDELKDRHILINNRPKGFSGRPVPVMGNKILLKTVFRNLVQNAIRHGEREGRIALDLEEQGEYLQVAFFNSGKPVPEGCRDRLFTGLMQVRGEENPGAGMGLGLYLVKKIINSLGGHIWYEGKDEGSRFVFTLPSK